MVPASIKSWTRYVLVIVSLQLALLRLYGSDEDVMSTHIREDFGEAVTLGEFRL